MRSILLSTFAAALLAGCNTTTPPTTPTPPTNLRQLAVSRHNSVTLTNARADQILDDMTLIARTIDHAGDIPADVTFQRTGNVVVFSTGTGNIDSQADFVAVTSLPGEVKVVNQINWCGGIAPNIIGCARVPGTSLIVVRFNGNEEGVLWLHEHGHNKGRPHRNGATAVMDPTIAPNHRDLDQAEATAIEN